MSAVKNIARTLVYPFVTALGIEKFFAALSKNNKLILVYHGVVNSPNHSISVGPIATEQFRQHLLYFKKNFDIVSLETMFEMHRTGHTPRRKTIAITFDDGYENNYTNAYPLLKSLNIPATIFVVSQCTQQTDYITWYDHIYLFQKDLDATKVETALVNEPAVKSVAELIELIKSLNINEREVLFAEIKKHLPDKDYRATYTPEFWRLMNPQQLKELAHSGLIEIGAHSHNHPNLGLISLQQAKEEIRKSKSTLEEATQKEVRSIAFPDGSYTEEVKQLCYKAGYKNLLAVDYRCSSDNNDHNILPRYCISSTTTYESNIIQVNRHFASYGF